MPRKKDWAGLKSIGMVKKTIDKLNGDMVVETRYYISSLIDMDLFSKSVRSHWRIENSLHWQLDYTFKDDQNTTTEAHGAKNLQIIKKVGLAVLAVVKTLFGKVSLKRIRYLLSLDFEKNIELIFKALKAFQV
jgi:predicted transposase YbfD/YdcC